MLTGKGPILSLQKQVIPLLQQNLKQEEAMAKKVENLSKELGKQVVAQR
jgi:ferritin-like metal-binding protein YciE